MSIPWGPFGEDRLQGVKYLELLGPLLTDLHAAGTARDRAGNRHLFYDPYALLLLLYFFNPTMTSLRGLLPLVAVDGSLLPALPRMAWALWRDDRHRLGAGRVAALRPTG
ncbi:protein containing transposase, IS4-like domain protein [Methylocaldum marinum]|uniref:Protein containing transposase, IS4-like domain protein n=1 Tax=Methylocaldum marinum TaxID=1432792 RepID=A0A250KSB4_9GAMM|nr:hypothetical protein [Methylocaldum marinum]BBA33851.1 protein containing transposase, IS4-like domain protein [Methylocaldum marinum]